MVGEVKDYIIIKNQNKKLKKINKFQMTFITKHKKLLNIKNFNKIFKTIKIK